MPFFTEDEIKQVFIGAGMGAGAAVLRAWFGRDKRWKRFIARVLIGGLLGILASLIISSLGLPEVVNRLIFFACGWATKEIADKLASAGSKAVDASFKSDDARDDDHSE